MSTTVRTINFLPEIFQTTPNQQFLTATLDQLVQQPQLKNLRGFIGKKYGYGVKPTDHYIPELDNIRNNYQLEPAVIFNDPNTQTANDLLTYPGLLDALNFEGSSTKNNSSLFENQFYSWDSFVDLDKLINYSQYYWVPNGPDPVDVTTGDVFLTQDYVISSDYESYIFNVNAVALQNHNPTITLIRGGTYTFEINQDSKFWIQTTPGIEGPNYTNSTVREIDGVSNNGTNHGAITFTVPLSTDQDGWNYPGNIPIDLVTTMQFDQLNGQLLSTISDNIDDVYQLNGKTLLFYGTAPGTQVAINQFFDEEAFDENVDTTGNFDNTKYVEVNKNYYMINILGSGPDYVIQLTVAGELLDNTKITIGYGKKYTGRNFVKNSYGEIFIVPFITANLNTLYYQDDTIGTRAGKIILIDEPNFKYLDVTDIMGRKRYTSPNGIPFSNGLKVQFSGNVYPKSYKNNVYYIEGVGSSIQLLPLSDFIVPEPFSVAVTSPYDYDRYPYDFFPYDETHFYPVTQDYLTINRASPNKNAWARSNNWFHIDVLNTTIKYATTAPNSTTALANPNARAKRPVIEFYPNLKLFHSGINAKGSIDYINFSATDALNQVANQTLFAPDGEASYVFNGARIVFAGDKNPEVRNKIYVVNFITLSGSQAPTITLSLASDGDNIGYGDQFVVLDGYAHNGQSFYFDGLNWKQAQFKQYINQAPLFDLFDSNGNSLGDVNYYPGTNFTGCTLFKYASSTSGVDDPVLGFPLAYTYVGNIGDITFDYTLNTDTFTYVINNKPTTSNVSIGYVYSYDQSQTLTRLIGWQTAVGNSFQYQVFNFIYTGNATFKLDILAKDNQVSTSWPTVVVYINNVLVNSNQYTVTNTASTSTIALVNLPAVNTPITIKIYSEQTSSIGYYEIPSNLDHNPFNTPIDNINLGDIRTHYESICDNVPNLTGNVFGSNNYRDLGNPIQYGTSIVQHSAPLLAAASFLKNDKNNFFDALNYNASQYESFKNLLLNTLNNLDLQYLNNNISAILDQVLKYIAQANNSSSPFYWSDMLPAGVPIATSTYTFKTTSNNTIYPTTAIYNFSSANYQSVLVYLTRKNTQTLLIKNTDYVLSTELPALEVVKQLVSGDIITIKEYATTYGTYVPSTPTKLGFYPAYIPTVKQDNTYITPGINFIVGHDGSYTKMYGTLDNGIFSDLRDRLILEFETRIYNNLKNKQSIPITYDEVVPGQFRDTGITYQEYLAVYTPQFLNWVGSNNINYARQYYLSGNSYTWNYSQSSYKINNKLSGSRIQQGNWRGIYLWLYDTCNPDTAPWEMLGINNKPNWWDEYYGPAPYTSENSVMWTDISNGYVWNAGSPYINNNRVRLGLLDIIPVDTNGVALDPFELLVGNYDIETFQSDWTAGDVGPAEYTYLKSSTWPFDLMRIMALLKPAQYFGLGLNLDQYTYNNEFNQYLTNNRYRAPITDLQIYGTSGGTASHSYVNWIVDYSTQYGVQGATQVYTALSNINVQLTYRCAGFTDHSLVSFMVEKISAADTTTSLVIPNENYQILLYTNQPSASIIYSSIIVQKTANGYAVHGNSKTQLYFVAYLPQDTGFYDTITVNGNSAIVSKNYTTISVVVPYGTEFNTTKDLLEFVKGYGLYLNDQGMQFNDVENNISVTWNQMLTEIIYWINTGWDIGSVVNVNPAANIITIEKPNLVVQSLVDTNNGGILNQNLIPINFKDLSIHRLDNTLTITPLNGGDSLSYISTNLTSTEHVVIFDNYTNFNDLIFNLVTGLKTPRMIINGKITDNWNGTLNAPGFFLNQDNVQTWQPDVKYNKGDIVKYKNNYWQANTTIVQPDTTFNYTQWIKTNYNLVDKGLLPNSSTRSAESELFYNSNTQNFSADSDLLSFSLIGYRPRAYLTKANINPVSEVNFYKGMIQTKGTDNSIGLLDGITLNGTQLNYTTHENWAIQTHEYGGILNQNFIDFTLNKSLITGNPGIVSLITSDGVTGAQQQIPLSSIQNFGRGIYNTNILPVVNASAYEEKFSTAGYVSLNDVFASGYTIADLNTIGISTVYRNDYLWVASVNNDWDVYTPLPINANVAKISNNLNGTVNVMFNGPHGLLKNQNIGILNFNRLIDGYYTVTDIVNLNAIVITLSLPSTVTSIVNTGIAYLLQSQRVRSTADINGLPLTNAEFTNNTVWVDNDISGSWATYEKTNNYAFENLNASVISSKAYGTNVAYIPNFGYIVTDSTLGILYQYHRSPIGIYNSTGTIVGPRTNSNFGYSITYNNEYLIVSSLQLTGLNEISELYIYKIPTAPEITSVVLEQVIQIGINGDGTTPDQVQSMALSGDGNILWVALPFYNAVELYFQEKYLHYSSTGLSLHDTTTYNGKSFTVSGNQLSTILGGQRVNFIAGFTQVATLTAMANSSTGSTSAIDPYNPPLVNGASNWDRIGNYFYVSGEVSFATGQKIAFSNSNVADHTIFTVSYTQYESGNTTVFINEQFATTLTVAVPVNTPVYTVTFTDSAVYTIITGTYDSGKNITTFYTVEPITHTATSGNIIYKASVKFTYLAIDAGPDSVPGDQFGYSIATNYDGTKLFVGAPYAAFGPNLSAVGAVYVYDRLVETWQVQQDVYPWELYRLVLPYIPLPNSKIFVNGVLLGNNEYIVALNVVTISARLYAGDLIVLSTTNIVLNAKLTGFGGDTNKLGFDLSQARQDTLFGYSVSCNTIGSELLVGSPFSITTDGKDGAVYRFTNEGKKYGTITGFIAANVNEPSMMFLNGYRINLERYALLQAPTTTASTSMIVDLYSASLLPPNGTITIDNLLATQETFTYTSVNRATGQINLGIIIATAIVDTGASTVVLNFIEPLNTTPFAVGSSIVLTGMFPTALNGTFTVIACTTNTVTFAMPTGHGLVTTEYVQTTGSVVSTTPLAYTHSINAILTVPLGNATNIANHINQYGISNVFAYASEDERLHIRLKFANLAPANNKLNISVFNNVVLYQLGFIAYTQTQTITDPNPQTRTQFGYKVQFNEKNSFVVSAPVANRLEFTTFDSVSANTHNNTVFDNNLTQFIDTEYAAGTVYMYDYLPCADESITNTGQYVFAQSCNDTDLDYGSYPYYGTALSFNNDVVMIGNPKYKSSTVGGKVVVYQNTKSGKTNWNVLRTPGTIVDIGTINKVQMYNNIDGTMLTSLDYIDPLQGKLLGAVAENLDFISNSDPASYNSTGYGTGNRVWGSNQVGKIWFNTSTTKFLNYHQNDIVYNSQYWGQIFPGSTVTVYTWVKSLTPPATYADTVTGVPYDIKKYSIETGLDSNNNLIAYYFYWVQNTNKVNTLQGKVLSDTIIAQYITNPQRSGISYFAGLLPNVYGFYNVAEYISGTNTNVYLGFGLSDKNDTKNHKQYKLIREGYSEDFLPGFVDLARGYVTPTGLYEKLLDSMAGTDLNGANIPDYTLPRVQQIGINIRPKQSFFINRLGAVKNYLEYANSILINYPILESDNLTYLNQTDGATYSTNLYWTPSYWWATGYDNTTTVLFDVSSYAELLKVSAVEGLILGVAQNSAGNREVYLYTTGAWTRIGLQNGTLQFSNSLWNYADKLTGFGENFFDTILFDYFPDTETKYIIRALNEQIYTGPLLQYRNSSLILLFNYIQSENVESINYLPWLNKTSFVDITYNVRELLTDPTYQPDNESLLEGYITEAKPYHTVIKEFLQTYNANDTYGGDIVDFDLPPSYSANINSFISPKLTYNKFGDLLSEFSITDPVWQNNNEYTTWINNFGLKFASNNNTVVTYTSSYISLTDNIIQVQVAAGMPVTGIITIDQEQIGYTVINTDTNTITGLSRGLNGTGVTDHLPGSAILIDLPGVIVMNTGRAYSSIPTITAQIDTTKYPAPTKPAVLLAEMSIDRVIGITVVDPGQGYVVTPTIVIEPSFSVTFGTSAIEFLNNTLILEIDPTHAVNLTNGDFVQVTNTSSNGSSLIPNGYYYIRLVDPVNDVYLVHISFYTKHSDSLMARHPLTFSNQQTLSSDFTITLSLGAYAIPNMESSLVRGISTVLKFDRITYHSKVTPWVPNQYYAAPYISLGNTSSDPTTLSYANAVGPLTASNYTHTGTGTGAQFIVYNLLLGGTYTTTVIEAGTNYGVGDVITIAGASLYGSTPTDNCIITVSSINSAGGITGITTSGTAIDAQLASLQGAVLPIIAVTNSSGTAVVTLNYAPSGLKPGQINNSYMYFYTVYSPYIYDDTASSGAKIQINRPRFDPTELRNSYYITILEQGTKYNDGDIINISGSLLGGTDVINDCRILVNYANGGNISISTVSGTAVGHFAQFFVKVISNTEVILFNDATMKSAVTSAQFTWTTSDFGYIPQPFSNSYNYTTSSTVAYAGQIWQCVESNNDNTFIASKWYPLLSSDNSLNALDRIEGYYNPTSTMPGRDIQQIVNGVTYPNTTYRGNDFAPEDVLPLDYIIQDSQFFPKGLNIASIIYDGSKYLIVGDSDKSSVVLTSTNLSSWDIIVLSNTPLGVTNIEYNFDTNTRLPNRESSTYIITTTNKLTPMIISFDGAVWIGPTVFKGYDEIDFDTENYDIASLQVPTGVSLYSAILTSSKKSIAFGTTLITSDNGNWFWAENIYHFGSRLTNYIVEAIPVNNSNFVGYMAVGHGQRIINQNNPLLSVVDESLLLYSTNGETWNKLEPSISSNGFNGIASSSNLNRIVIVGDNGDIWYKDIITAWISGTVMGSAVTENINSVAYGNSLFVAVGDNGVILNSVDGITWTQITSSYITTNTLNKVRFLNGYFFATGKNNTLLQSNNGSNWTSVSGVTSVVPYYSIQGADFLFGYGPEEMVAGVVTDVPTLTVTTTPGASWDMDLSEDYWIYHTGFGMVKKTTTLDATNSVSFANLVINPAQLSVFVVNLNTKVSHRIYSEIVTNPLNVYTYTIDWIAQTVTMNSTLPTGYALMIEVYEVGNAMELYRGNTNHVPLYINADGNSSIQLDIPYTSISSNPVVFHNGTMLVNNTDYTISSTISGRVQLDFVTAYDTTTDYIVFSIVGDNINLPTTPNTGSGYISTNNIQYEYSIPLTEVFQNVDVSGILELKNLLPIQDPFTVAGNVDPLSHVIVEVNGIRLNYTTEYTLDPVLNRLNIVNYAGQVWYNTNNIFAVTAYNDTSRQHLQTITSTSANSGVLAITTPQSIYPKENIQYTDATRTWVTVNGLRVIPDQLSFDASNNLTISGIAINSGDVVTVTAMVSTASPNATTFMINADKNGNATVYNMNLGNSTWLVQTLYPTQDIIYFNNVSNIVDIVNGELVGKTIYINGEQIIFKAIDLVANTVSNLVRGANGTGFFTRPIPAYTTAYKATSNKLQSNQYTTTWITTKTDTAVVPNTTFKEPLQISTSTAANFLNSGSF